MDGEDEGARALYQHLLDGWNQRRAGRMAELFLDDSLVVGFGGSTPARFDGRRKLAAELTAELEDAGLRSV